MLLFDDGKDQLLFDCHVTRPSIMTCLAGKLSTDKDIADRVIREFKIDRLRGIFISHSHHDHVLDAPYFSVKCHAAVYGSSSALNVARGGGAGEDMLYSYEDAREYQIGNFHVRILESLHSEPHWYNNDIGKTIDRPLAQPAGKSEFKEGGSYDFLISCQEKNYLIRPSYNYIDGQLDHIRADVLFLGIGGLSRDSKERRKAFFEETIGKTECKTVVPVHWDNFFTPLYGPVRGMPSVIEDTGASLHLLARCCSQKGINCFVQMPLSSAEF